MVTEDPVDRPKLDYVPLLTQDTGLANVSHVRQRVMEKLCGFGCTRLMMMMMILDLKKLQDLGKEEEDKMSLG